MGKYDWLWIVGGIVIIAIGTGIYLYKTKDIDFAPPLDYVTYGQPFPRESAFKLSPSHDVNPYPYDFLYSEVPY